MNRWPFKKKITTLDPLTGYNLWAEKYGRESNPIKNLSDQFITSHLPALENKSVLDVGCGAGKFCKLAEGQQASKIMGIDLSPEMITVAKKNCHRTDFIINDAALVPLEKNSFDIVICALMLAHQKELEPTLSVLIQSLTPRGQLLITDFHPYLTLMNAKRTFTGTDNKTYEVEHYLHLFEAYFKCVKKYGATIKHLEEPFYNNSPAIFGMIITPA